MAATLLRLSDSNQRVRTHDGFNIRLDLITEVVYILDPPPDRIMSVVALSRVMLVRPVVAARVYNEPTREMLIKPAPAMRVFKEGW